MQLFPKPADLMKKFAAFLFLSLLPIFVLAANKVEINTASPEQLDEIVGIGPALAQRIINARPFSSIEDLLKVKGIGEKTLQKIKAQGLAYVKGQTTLPAQEADQIPNTDYQDTAKNYPKGIVINEILAAPEGADEEEEWIEIFNQNDFEVALSGWKIKDKIGAATSYFFPAGKKIAAKEYLVLTRPVAKITLNNSGDGLEITNPNGEVVDSVDFGSTTKNQSYNRIDSGWKWSSILTPGKENSISQKSSNPVTKKTQSRDSQSTNQDNLKAPENNFSSAEKTATVSEKIPGSSNFSSVLFLAAAIAFASGFGILFLKKKLLQK